MRTDMEPMKLLVHFLIVFWTIEGSFQSTSGSATEEGHIQITLSNKGIDYVKDLLVSHVQHALSNLNIHDIEKSLSIPIIGEGMFRMSNFSVTGIDVQSSSVELEKSRINIVASDVRVNCSMNWRYSYTVWLIPFRIKDKGRADIEFKDLEVGIAFTLGEKNGSLYLQTLECGTYLKDITITLHGGASWLYQGFLDAFEDKIRAAVETTMTKNLMESITRLNTTLLNFPQVVGIQENIAVNFTVMQAPVIDPTSIHIGVDGLFVEIRPSYALSLPVYNLKSTISCSEPSKMLEIALTEDVLNSAAKVYTDTGLLNWVIDKGSEQYLLNTASWRLIIPQLYKKYPNDDMKLEISVSSPPRITVTRNGVSAVAVSDLVIDVVDGDATVQVACISMTISARVSMGVVGNNITGTAELGDISLELKWSNIGKLHMRLIQVIVRTLVKTAVFPLVNTQFKKGFPLPIVHSFGVKYAEIEYGESQMVVCADVQYLEKNASTSNVIATF